MASPKSLPTINVYIVHSTNDHNDTSSITTITIYIVFEQNTNISLIINIYQKHIEIHKNNNIISATPTLEALHPSHRVGVLEKTKKKKHPRSHGYARVSLPNGRTKNINHLGVCKPHFYSKAETLSIDKKPCLFKNIFNHIQPNRWSLHSLNTLDEAYLVLGKGLAMEKMHRREVPASSTSIRLLLKRSRAGVVLRRFQGSTTG